MTLLLVYALVFTCVWLIAEQRRLAARVLLLEDMVAAGAFTPDMAVQPEPVFAEPRRPAMVVRRAAPPPPELVEPAPSFESPEPEPIEPVRLEPPIEDEFAAPEQPARGGGFEEIFGRKLPIWAGGVTLAVAGFLVVKYSIDLGLLSPAIRALFGLLFGAGLIAGAEAAMRFEERVQDPRVAQALSGAGVATLYATVLVATNLYQLVSPVTGFAGLALVTLLAGLLALRFGPASAVLGLVGGLSAPALVGAGPPNMPLLACYLALTVGGLCALGRSRRWWWLGASAMVGGFGWGAALILGGVLDASASLSLGIYTLLIAIAFPFLIVGGQYERLIRWGGALAGTAQIAAIVALGGFGWLQWGLYGLISLAIVWLSRRDERLAALPAPALGVALLLLLIWTNAPVDRFAAALAGTALIFGVPAFLRLWRADGRLSDAVQLAAIGFALPVASAIAFGPDTSLLQLAALAFAGAAITGAAAARGWRAERSDARFPLLAITSAILVALGCAFALPAWLVPAALALLAAGLLSLSLAASDRRLEVSAWVMGVAALLGLMFGGQAEDLARAVDIASGQPDWKGALRWAVAAGSALLFALRGREMSRPTAQIVTISTAYVALAQMVAAPLLPVLVAAALPALAWATRARRSEVALATLAGIGVGWALVPALTWSVGGVEALGADPMFRSDVPGTLEVLTRLVPLALALVAALMLRGGETRLRAPAIALAGGLGLVALHSLWKQVFAIESLDAFVAYGMAERTLWELGFAAAAVLVFKRGLRVPALLLGGVSLGHFGLFTLALHNPLWENQAIGPWLVPAYAAAIGLVWAAQRFELSPTLARAREIGQMLLILAFGFTALRQLCYGSVIAWAPVGPVEDIARSVLAIGFAIGFLIWGIRSAKPEWRIASLLLMLGAVAKVFLLDAAGLDGLLRILSFAALGFSLIGVGWLYSRWLPARGTA